MPALQVRDLKKTYTTPDGAPCPVIDVASLDVGDGEQVALRGGSGTGKTTLLNLIAGILRPDAGSIRVGGTEIVGLAESARDRLRSLEIGYVFQTFNLLQGFTATENVVLAMSFGRGADAGRARELLERVGLKDRLDHRPRQLSVGQQQRVAIARALANRPKLVLADEPTGNLDPKNAAECLKLIREVCRESQAALLLVSHDTTVLEAFEKRLDLAEINRASQAVAR